LGNAPSTQNGADKGPPDAAVAEASMRSIFEDAIDSDRTMNDDSALLPPRAGRSWHPNSTYLSR